MIRKVHRRTRPDLLCAGSHSDTVKTRGRRAPHNWLRTIIVGFILLFLSAPGLMVAVLAFSGDDLLQFPAKAWSLRGFQEFASDATLRSALYRSILVAVGTTMGSVIAGLFAAIAILGAKSGLKAAITSFLSLGFALPLVVSGLGLMLVFYQLGVFGQLWTVSLAIAVVNMPFVIFAILASSEGMDPQMDEAALTLGATPGQVMLMVRIPSLAPGILMGGLLVFILSVTEFMVSMITTTASSATLPVVMFSSFRGGLTPSLAVAGVVYIGIAVFVVVVLAKTRLLRPFIVSRV